MSSSISQDDLYTDYYLFLPAATLAADKVRVVKTYAPSTGTLTVDKVYSASTIPNSAAYELHGFIEPLTDLPLLINEALKRTLIVREFNFAPVANNLIQDLTAQQSTLINPRWVRRVDRLPSGGDQIQTITEAGSPGGGTFTVSYRGSTSSAQAYDITAANLQVTLRALHADLAAVTVTRSGTTTNFVWVVTMTGARRYVPIFTASATSLTGGTSPSITPAITQDQSPFTRLSGYAFQDQQRVFVELDQRCNATDRLYVKIIKRAYDDCATSAGAYGAQAGLSLEGDLAIPPVEWVGSAVLTILARREQNSLSEKLQDAIARNGDRWAKEYKERTKQNFVLQSDAPLQLRNSPWFGPGPATARGFSSWP